ncbi:MAG: hypothetical protein PHF86_04475 [Candidatus Nanoarchaeia archaeon]|jgi:hypothetical protein|nr:hypothetical protein [Candidatus Nanoarchaeia archaeon]
MKLKLEFEGWHCLSNKDAKNILKTARLRFKNANFIDNSGLLVDTEDELDCFKFCLETISQYNKNLGSWDGYNIRKLSRRIVYNYQDKKRKLSFEYFKRLVTENKFEDIKVVLAGILYLTPEDVKVMLGTIERDLSKLFIEMDEQTLKISYNLLLKYSSSSIRNFSTDLQTKKE